MDDRAPVALFVYRRVDHTRRVIEALSANYGANETNLLIYADGPKSYSDQRPVSEVREYLSSLRMFKSIRLIFRERNLGLAQSIITGVSQTLEEYDTVIVLEDDHVTSPYFLWYMNDGLERYKHNERVISISGYVYPTRPLPTTFFIKGSDCWGWATWRRGWACFNSDGRKLLADLHRRGLVREFDFNDSYCFSCLLEGQVAGLNDSWAVRWYASAFLNDKLTLHPQQSLVQNIGNDSTGTHAGNTNIFDVQLSPVRIPVGDIVVEESLKARQAFEQFFREYTPRPSKIKMILKRILSPRQINLLRRLVRFSKSVFAPLSRRLVKYEVGEKPFMAETSVSKMTEILAQGGVFCEYGAGGSTIFALKSHVVEVVSVESDKRFLKAVKRKAAKYNKQFTPLYADIGSTKEWGMPSTTKFNEKWIRYPQMPWRYFCSKGIFPDIILIDGRFRVACALESLIRLGDHECIIMIDDYLNRPDYHVLEYGRFLTPIEMAGVMLVAKKSKEFDILKAQTSIRQYYRDPA